MARGILGESSTEKLFKEILKNLDPQVLIENVQKASHEKPIQNFEKVESSKFL